MKKILLVVCSIVVSSMLYLYPNQVQAVTNDNYYIYLSGNGFMYYPHYVDGNVAYILSPFNNYELTDISMINNLAYIGTLNDDKLFQATIQMLIMRYANPSFDVDLRYYNYSIVDYSEELSLIENLLLEYNNDNSLNNSFYEINLNDELILENIDLNNYELDNYNMEEVNNNTIIKGFSKTGMQELSFKGKLNIDNENYYTPLVYATSPITNDFTINVSVLGNKIDFDINIPKEDIYHFVFEMYDLNNNYLGYYLIDNTNNTIFYDLGYDIKLVDVSDSIYLNNADIIINENDSHTNTITLNKEYKKVELTLSSTNNNLDISLYDNSFNHIKDYRCKSSCNLYLDKKEYFIKDNLTNTYSYYNLNNTNEVVITGNIIKGIISKETINNIYSYDELVEYEKVNDVYFFKEDSNNTIYTLNIDNEFINVDFSNNNYLYINNYGLFYIYEKDTTNTDIGEDSIRDTESKVDNYEEYTKEVLKFNSIDEKVVEVKIPNTGNDLSLNIEYIVKKKYNCYFNFINTYIC